jgi:hypothetical protein
MLRSFFMAVLLVVVSPSVEKAEDFGASYALVVGIDHYQNPRWPALANGKSDAMAAIAFLESQNYQVTALLDQEATRANILGYFRTCLRERLAKGQRPVPISFLMDMAIRKNMARKISDILFPSMVTARPA